jgi:hypothetical protein
MSKHWIETDDGLIPRERVLRIFRRSVMDHGRKRWETVVEYQAPSGTRIVPTLFSVWEIGGDVIPESREFYSLEISYADDDVPAGLAKSPVIGWTVGAASWVEPVVIGGLSDCFDGWAVQCPDGSVLTGAGSTFASADDWYQAELVSMDRRQHIEAEREARA